MENNIAAESYAKVKKLASQDTSDYFANMMKGTTNGVITGGVLGLAIGFYKKYNLHSGNGILSNACFGLL